MKILTDKQKEERFKQKMRLQKWHEAHPNYNKDYYKRLKAGLIKPKTKNLKNLKEEDGVVNSGANSDTTEN